MAGTAAGTAAGTVAGTGCKAAGTDCREAGKAASTGCMEVDIPDRKAYGKDQAYGTDRKACNKDRVYGNHSSAYRNPSDQSSSALHRESCRSHSYPCCRENDDHHCNR